MVQTQPERHKKSKCSMRVFVAYNDERITLDVGKNDSVFTLKEVVREHFHIGPDEGPTGAEVQEKKLLTLNYAGSELQDSWTFADLGITPSITMKALLKEEVKPSMYVHCCYNDETLPLLEKIHFATMSIGDFRAMVSRKTGLPVSVFRVLDKNQREMYDCHTLEEYGIKLGSCVRLETWDGWNDFLNLTILGFTSDVLANVMNDDVVSRFQLKVALCMAAHFGHVDLAMSLLRMGIRADEPIGEHPIRQWCKQAIVHIDSLKAPIHEAAESGQLGVLRCFVNHSIANALAKDGNGLTPLNIALRKKKKACASFLLTKQWSKISYTKNTSIGLSVYVKMKKWCEKSKDRVLLMQGQWKSSIKNPRRQASTGALIGYGVQLDGYSQSKMTSKSTTLARLEEEQECRKLETWRYRDAKQSTSPESYFKSLEAAHSNKLPKISRFKRTTSRSSLLDKVKLVAADIEDKTHASPENEPNANTPSPDMKRKANATSVDTSFKLPPIKETIAKLSQQPPRISNNESNVEAKSEISLMDAKTKSAYLKTGSKGTAAFCHSSPHSPPTKQSCSSSSLAESSITRKSLAEKDMNRQLIKSTKNDKIAAATTTKTAATTKAKRTLHDKGHPAMTSKFSNDALYTATLNVYERYRGIKSREYATQCMMVASSFKEKPWLTQVYQAMNIAALGVRRSHHQQPSIFANSRDPMSPIALTQCSAANTAVL